MQPSALNNLRLFSRAPARRSAGAACGQGAGRASRGPSTTCGAPRGTQGCLSSGPTIGSWLGSRPAGFLQFCRQRVSLLPAAQLHSQPSTAWLACRPNTPTCFGGHRRCCDGGCLGAQATPPATPDPPPAVAAVSGFGIAPGTRASPGNNPGAGRGAPSLAQRPTTPPSALANSLRSSPSPPREAEPAGAAVAGAPPGPAISAEELAKQTARRGKVPALCQMLRGCVPWRAWWPGCSFWRCIASPLCGNCVCECAIARRTSAAVPGLHAWLVPASCQPPGYELSACICGRA